MGEIHRPEWTEKENRMYEHVKETEILRGKTEAIATRIAAATVNKYRSAHGETKQ